MWLNKVTYLLTYLLTSLDINNPPVFDNHPTRKLVTSAPRAYL